MAPGKPFDLGARSCFSKSDMNIGQGTDEKTDAQMPLYVPCFLGLWVVHRLVGFTPNSVEQHSRLDSQLLSLPPLCSPSPFARLYIELL